MWRILVLFVFTLLAEAFPIPVPPLSGSISLSFVTIFAAILSEGPIWGTLIATLGTIRPLDFSGQVSIRGILFNRFQLGLSAWVSGYVYHAVSIDDQITALRSVVGFFVAGMAYFSVNVLLFGLYVWRYKRVSINRVLNQLRVNGVANYVALMPLAYLIAAIQERVGLFGVLLFLLPLAVARFSFQRYLDVHHMFLSTIRALALALEAKDRYTYGHADRVARLSVEIGKALNLPDKQLELLQYAGILHDIGKIGVRDEILNKPGRYTQEEYEEMKKHPVIGARIVSGVDSLEVVARWIRHHHEKFDGTGYPDGLKGADIPLGARIIAVADAFDAMLYDRPYKAGRPLPEVIDELKRCSGSHFDPEVVSILLKLIETPERVAELTRPPELRFVEYLASIYGLRPPMPIIQELPAADEAAVAAEEFQERPEYPEM
ncbi:HD domain-containing protein [Thermaerobacter sp. PB12/4term]|nr:HD domain-containing protein [Thermaerobacter sp. PB12/4term]